MTATRVLGRVYSCPVCGAEVTIISLRAGDFAPRCCNTAMQPKARHAIAYRCPVCGAMVMIVHHGRDGQFEPHCCNTVMLRLAA